MTPAFTPKHAALMSIVLVLWHLSVSRW